MSKTMHKPSIMALTLTALVAVTKVSAQTTPAGGVDVIRIDDCLQGTVTERLADGAMRVRRHPIDTSACRQQDPALTSYTLAAAADTLSTAIGLGMGGRTLAEANPSGVAGGLAVKTAGWVALRTTEPSHSRTRWASRANAVQWGAASSNLCLIAKAAAPACYVVCLTVGAVQWPQ